MFEYRDFLKPEDPDAEIRAIIDSPFTPRWAVVIASRLIVNEQSDYVALPGEHRIIDPVDAANVLEFLAGAFSRRTDAMFEAHRAAQD